MKFNFINILPKAVGLYIVLLFLASCWAQQTIRESDLHYFETQNWILKNYNFELDERNTSLMFEGEWNIGVIGRQKDTTIFFEYFKMGKDLFPGNYLKLYETLENGKKLYHRIGLKKKDTLFYYISTIPKNAIRIDSMQFIKGKKYYLKSIGKSSDSTNLN